MSLSRYHHTKIMCSVSAFVTCVCSWSESIAVTRVSLVMPVKCTRERLKFTYNPPKSGLLKNRNSLGIFKSPFTWQNAFINRSLTIGILRIPGGSRFQDYIVFVLTFLIKPSCSFVFGTFPMQSALSCKV